MMGLIAKGGWVMVPLLGFSLLALTIIIERTCRFSMLARAERFDRDGLLRRAYDGRPPADAGAGGEVPYPYSDIAGICAAAAPRGAGEMKRRLKTYLIAFDRVTGRGIRALGIIAHTAPLLGLMGTIMGMIQAFMRIQELGGRVNASVLAGGIWEALLTTAFGLIIAIPSLIAFHWLESLQARHLTAAKDFAENILSAYAERTHGNRT
ncbi:MAG: MotA/TolQ/ExbB proton channel family protein [bacterium]|nr:MotA/TolQ/ExbB proton channel family protein [bacterium]